MADLVTTGSGSVEIIADRAEITATFDGTATRRDSAIAALTERLRDVEPAFDVPGVEVRRRSLSAHPTWKGNKRVGYRAELHLTLRVVDLDALDALIAALVSAEPARLDGPHWSARDETAADAAGEAQRRAVATARRRAEGYAAALGARLGTLVRLVDESRDVHPYAAYGRAMTMAADVSESQIAELDLTPTPVEVSASCTTTWVLLE